MSDTTRQTGPGPAPELDQILERDETPERDAAPESDDGHRPIRWFAHSKHEQNDAVFDPWTAVHLGSGLAFGLMNIPIGRTLAAALAYEVVEQMAERRRWGRRLFESSGPESAANVATDMLALAAGWWLGRRWNATGPAREPRSG